MYVLIGAICQCANNVMCVYSQECYIRIWDRDWDVDFDGYQPFCCLCAEGGEVVLCDICDNVGCTSCISRVCGKPFCKKLLSEADQPWLCFSCNPQPLHKLMRMRRRLMDALRSGAESDHQGESR